MLVTFNCAASVFAAYVLNFFGIFDCICAAKSSRTCAPKPNVPNGEISFAKDLRIFLINF